MPRVRIGVVLLLPEPWKSEIDGIRRALGAPSLTQIVPHITVVSPINVRSNDVPLAIDIVRAVAQHMQPFSVRVGPASTFSPSTPVITLGISHGREVLNHMNVELRSGVFDREPTWPYEPHVTLHEGASQELIESALQTLMRYETTVSFSDVWILRQEDDHVWRPLADARFELPARIGTGGLAVEISRTTLMDPHVREVLEVDDAETTIAFTARREGSVVGVLAANEGREFQVLELRVAKSERGQGIGTHLLRQAQFAARQQGYSQVWDAARCAHVAALMHRFAAPGA